MQSRNSLLLHGPEAVLVPKTDISLLNSDISVSDENCLLILLQQVVLVGTIFVLLFITVSVI